ncbi:MAG: hypothetical protein ACUVTL_10535 [Thermoproteota archaeon]
MECEFCGEKFEKQEELNKHLRFKHKDKIRLAIFEHPEKKARKKNIEQNSSSQKIE